MAFVASVSNKHLEHDISVSNITAAPMSLEKLFEK